jgi:hypothetical protein
MCVEQSNTPQPRFNFLLINLILLSFVILVAGLVAVIDYPRYINANPGQTPNLWYFDTDVGFNSGAKKGPGMVISILFEAIAAVICFLAAFKINQIRQHKTDKHLSSMVFYAAIYLGIARLDEIYYIITNTDLKDIMYGFGRFYIILDVLGMMISVVFCVEIFLVEELMKSQERLKRLIKFSMIALFLSLVSVISNFYENAVFNGIAVALSGVSLLYVLIQTIDTLKRINAVKKKVEEQQNALQAIGLQLCIYLVVVVISIYILLSSATLFQYSLRATKNLLQIVNALLFFPAFITPAKK